MYVCVCQFLELCHSATDNDSVVLKLLQQKYNQANRHFLWSDEFCKLVETYTARIRADPTNKYVHIRDIVSELKAYKAKPMKQVMPVTFTVGLDGDTGNSPPAKRTKMEPVDVKEELRTPKQESSSLPALLRFSKSCTFTPLSAMGVGTKNVDLSECRVIDVSDDDSSSQGGSADDSVQGSTHLVTIEENDNGSTELATAVHSHLPDHAPSASSATDSASGSVELLQPDESTVSEGSPKPGPSRAEDPVEVTAETVTGDGCKPVTECADDDRRAGRSTKVKGKLPSTRHIRYLETLLAV